MVALETRHTEKQALFNVLKAIKRDPALAKSRELRDAVIAMKAVMEAEDVAVVEKKVAELD